ncbi:MAG TPA: hypothetical protein VFB59_02175, partial [Candidatus Saccharimonadales bacterium]|nr:hypothetical protein [Candidatus Saccharimonadales bacterium]
MADKPDNDTEKKVAGAPELPKDNKKQDLTGPDQDKEQPSFEPQTAQSDSDETLDDQKTADAVDDIIRNESDELLEAQDAKTQKVLPDGKKSWWRRAWLRWVLLLVLLAAGGAMAYPKSRYWVLNTAGMRVSASVVVVDNTTGQPLKNVTVSLGGGQAFTDADGKAKVDKVKLGRATLKLERIAFAPQEKQVVLGWGSNPLGRFELQAVGAQYTVVVRDFLSNQPIEGAEASSGQAAARSDNTGKIILTLDKSDGSDVTAILAAPGYRSEEVTLKAAVTNELVLVPSAKDVFVSKESGKYDVYTMDADGKNKKLLLAGTGLESGNIGLAVSPDGERVALVSTRDNVRTADGRLL